MSRPIDGVTVCVQHCERHEVHHHPDEACPLCEGEERHLDRRLEKRSMRLCSPAKTADRQSLRRASRR